MLLNFCKTLGRFFYQQRVLHFFLWSLLMSTAGIKVNAQPIYLKLNLTANADAKAQDIIKKQNLNPAYKDSLSAAKDLQLLVTSFYENGFLACTIDNIFKSDSSLIAELNCGKQFKWAKISTRKEDDYILDEAGVKLRLLKNKPYSPPQVASVIKQILKFTEDNGYPFASVDFKNIKINENTIEAELNINKNQLIKIDTIEVIGDAKLSEAYLHNYISISPGDLYNETFMRRITSRIRELPFVAETKSPLVKFYPGKCRVILYLDNKKSSQIDGILGVLPGNDATQKTQITGELRLRLQNSFAHGELIELNWKQPKKLTQDLKIRLTYPFLFQSHFGLDGALTLYKADTTYLNVDRMLGVNYFLPGGNFLKLFVDYQTSDLLNAKSFENATVLPPYADISKTLFGLGLRKEQLDYRYNPRRGYSAEFVLQVGKKKIEQNSKLNPALYDSVQLSSTNYSGEIIFNYYFPIAQRHVINAGMQSAYLRTQNLFTNELYRIGGLRTLRGFDEESIYASRYFIGKLEYRFLLDQDSYLFAFYNQAYYENDANSTLIHDTPLGFGAGISFATKLGIFAFNYALGKQFNNPVYLRSAKIHFGIINYF